MRNVEVAALRAMLMNHLVHEDVGRLGISVLHYVADIQAVAGRDGGVRCSRRTLSLKIGASRDAVSKAVDRCAEKGWLMVKGPFPDDPDQAVFMKILIPDDSVLKLLDELCTQFEMFIKELVDNTQAISIQEGLSMADYYLKNKCLFVGRSQTTARVVLEKLSIRFQDSQGGGQKNGQVFLGGWPETLPPPPTTCSGGGQEIGSPGQFSCQGYAPPPPPDVLDGLEI